jgi:hypothetical protein
MEWRELRRFLNENLLALDKISQCLPRDGARKQRASWIRRRA